MEWSGLFLEIIGPSFSLSFIMTLRKVIPEQILMKDLLGLQSTSVLILCTSEVWLIKCTAAILRRVSKFTNAVWHAAVAPTTK